AAAVGRTDHAARGPAGRAGDGARARGRLVELRAVELEPQHLAAATGPAVDHRPHRVLVPEDEAAGVHPRERGAGALELLQRVRVVQLVLAQVVLVVGE